MRAVVPASFAIDIKLNSGDLPRSGDMKDAMQQTRHVTATVIDVHEIISGNYDDPKMYGRENDRDEKASERTAECEADFLEFARAGRDGS